jgi:gluconolactonase
MGAGGHDLEQRAAILPDALRCIWRDYPASIQLHEPAAYGKSDWDPRGKPLSIISYDQPWELLADGYQSVTSLARDRDGNVFFLDSTTDRVYKVNTASRSAEDLGVFKGAKAIAIGEDNRLYVTQPSRRRIVSYAPGGGSEKLYAQNVIADRLAPRRGQIYFLNTADRTLGVAEPNGKTRLVYDKGEMGMPAAMALSPDGEMLVVSDAGARFSWSFQIGNTLQYGEPFFRLEMPEAGLPRGATGVAHDETGQVYFATPLGIQICEPNGRMATILNAPEPGAFDDIVFGGKNWKYLYAAEKNKLYRRPVKIAGTAPFTPSKPPKPAL